MLIESLLEAGMSFRAISSIAGCSHGSVSAQKKEWLAKKSQLKLQEQENHNPDLQSTMTLPSVAGGETPPMSTLLPPVPAV